MDNPINEGDEQLKARLDDTDKPVRWQNSPERKAVQKADGYKRRRQIKFLNAYSQLGRITDAAKVASVNATTHRRWLDTDPWYRDRFEEADQAFCDALEKEVYRRAVEGTDKPVIYKGMITDTYKEYSDNLLMFITKSKITRYRDKMEVSGKDGGPIETTSPLATLLDRIGTIAERDPIDITPVPDGAIDLKKEETPRKQLPASEEGDEAINPDLLDG